MENAAFPAILECGTDGYGVYFPDLPGCVSAGTTFTEAVTGASEALGGHLDIMKEFGDEVPPPSTLAAISVEKGSQVVGRLLICRDNVALKSCPHCDGEAEVIFPHNGNRPYVMCKVCISAGPQDDDPVTGWNRRSSETLASAPAGDGVRLDICPQCSGSGVGVADSICTLCGGTGGVPVNPDMAAERWQAERPIAASYDDNRQYQVAVMAWEKRKPFAALARPRAAVETELRAALGVAKRAIVQAAKDTLWCDDSPAETVVDRIDAALTGTGERTVADSQRDFIAAIVEGAPSGEATIVEYAPDGSGWSVYDRTRHPAHFFGNVSGGQSEAERKMLNALQDIAGAEPIPNDAVAFVWCQKVAQDTLGELKSPSHKARD